MAKHAFLSASAFPQMAGMPVFSKVMFRAGGQGKSLCTVGTDCHELCAYLVEKELGRM